MQQRNLPDYKIFNSNQGVKAYHTFLGHSTIAEFAIWCLLASKNIHATPDELDAFVEAWEAFKTN